jgi:hypothetical protein
MMRMDRSKRSARPSRAVDLRPMPGEPVMNRPLHGDEYASSRHHAIGQGRMTASACDTMLRMKAAARSRREMTGHALDGVWGSRVEKHCSGVG